MEDELCYLSAVELRRRFAAQALSPVAYLEAIQARTAAVEPKVNALVAQYWAEARALAEEAERRYRAGKARPLEGIPFLVKDDTSVRGQARAACSFAYAGYIDEYTNPSIQRLLDAGAIQVGRSACSELTYSWACRSPVHGNTHNPWNLAITSGGSSGGSAAALAAGMIPLAMGTDSAGSVRMPSAMCGVVGYKPPSGRNPKGFEDFADPYNTMGPLARTVEDCALMQNIISGPHPADHQSLRPKVEIGWPLPDVAGLEIAYSLDLGFLRVAPDVRRNTLAVIERLRALGAKVNEVEIDWAEEALAAADHHSSLYLAYELCDLATPEEKRLLGADMQPLVAEMATVGRAAFMEAEVAAYDAWLVFGAVLERHHAFICPTVTTTDIPFDWELEAPIEIDGAPADRFTTTMLFNMFGNCPALTVPSGFAENGVPTGLQIAGRTFDDEMVFRIGAALERQAPLYDHAARRPALTGAGASTKRSN